MTVLELKKKSCEDEPGRRGEGADADAGGFFHFRWRLFGKAPPAPPPPPPEPQDNRDKQQDDRESNPPHRSDKMEAPPKKTLGSLRRSLSLRIRRSGRPREDAGPGAGAGAETSRPAPGRDSSVPPRPFSYLTGRTLPPRRNQGTQAAVAAAAAAAAGGTQVIQYQRQGKVKVMEVPPFSPARLGSGSVGGGPAAPQEEASIWQLIANRFRRKEQALLFSIQSIAVCSHFTCIVII
jgi:hypothetical protein